MKKILITALITLLGLQASFSAGAGWMTDFDAAKAKAQAEGKPMLLDFTGSDWCGWCIKLDEEVFSQPTFQEYAEDAFVLVELDFPRSKTQSSELKAQNEALARAYGIRGFPTILVLSPEGQLIEKTGYRRGGAEQYVEHLQQIIASAQ
ncbi:thioredoxin family protein [Coraliomargarita sp. SDUM461004]|uniref:Thioredoxin family protein n=1 Tax=Thalassobacterium sedimentorum TaxID=3041258 RepID=A0ABU1AJE2_9BACT|nr:thioredoxin family protein [Coraliomargarita sp. SDUM461004]MDQ8193733.1 thioredoxin family protein [Coraliomargarita sp. SDUM461004]